MQMEKNRIQKKKTKKNGKSEIPKGENALSLQRYKQTALLLNVI